MRSRHSVEEKFEIVMEALTENTTQAEICRRHGIFPCLDFINSLTILFLYYLSFIIVVVCPLIELEQYNVNIISKEGYMEVYP